MKFTRDDLKWLIGMIAAIVVGLATLGNTITDYGIPVAWLPYIRLGALIVGIISGKLATSPLPGRDGAAAGKVGVGLLAIALAGSTLVGCASARTVAIVADQTFATAVFALDDAEWAAYQTHVISDAQHAQLNPPIRKALEDVKAVTLAIKAAPSGQVPQSLPALLADLQAVQTAILAAAPIAPSIAAKAAAANSEAIGLLQQLLGGAK